MSYVKQDWNKYTWEKGQNNMQDMLNHMEDGIADASSGEPANYIKTASVSQTDNTLTLTTNKDVSVAFKPYAYSPFPQHFVVNGTTYQFAQSVLSSQTDFKAGKCWYGELYCTDLPSGLLNAECMVTALTNTIALIELSSSNRAPYRWEYNTDSYGDTSNDGWKFVLEVKESDMPTTNGTYTLKLQKSGSNITVKCVADS